MQSETQAKYWDAAQSDPRKPSRPSKSNETSGHIHIRIPGAQGRKTAYVHAARRESLATWMARILDREANYRPNEKL